MMLMVEMLKKMPNKIEKNLKKLFRSDQRAVTLVRATVGEQKRGGGFAIGVGFQGWHHKYSLPYCKKRPLYVSSLFAVQKKDRHELKREESDKKTALSIQTKCEDVSTPGSPKISSPPTSRKVFTSKSPEASPPGPLGNGARLKDSNQGFPDAEDANMKVKWKIEYKL